MTETATKPKGWTPERTERLSELWKQGYSASEIALRLGDVTRNAVLGKVNRLGLPKRLTRMTVRRRRPRMVRPRRGITSEYMRGRPDKTQRHGHIIVQPIKASRMANGRLAETTDLTRKMCRWPFGNPEDKDFHYCGRQSEGGSSYCHTHDNLAYDRKRPRATYSEKYLNKLSVL